MAKSEFKDVITQMVVPDVVKTAEYYRDVLGFEILGYFLDPPVYAMLRRGNVEMHFGKSDTGEVLRNESIRKGLGTDAYIFVSDVHALYEEYSAAGANIKMGITKRPYGCTEFEILDCDGHKIVFAD